MRVMILADGDPPSPALAQRVADEADVCIAADGAAHKAILLGITPDIVCGDFDSARLEEIRVAFPHTEIVPTPDQNAADLEKAINLSCERGATQIALLGATGGRLDHTLTSFSLLRAYADTLPICLLDDHSTVRALTGEQTYTFAAASGETVSLVTFEDAVISIMGVEWPLDHFALSPGTRGVSNIARDTQVVVYAHTGSVYVIHFSPQSMPFENAQN